MYGKPEPGHQTRMWNIGLSVSGGRTKEERRETESWDVGVLSPLRPWGEGESILKAGIDVQGRGNHSGGQGWPGLSTQRNISWEIGPEEPPKPLGAHPLLWWDSIIPTWKRAEWWLISLSFGWGEKITPHGRPAEENTQNKEQMETGTI